MTAIRDHLADRVVEVASRCFEEIYVDGRPVGGRKAEGPAGGRTVASIEVFDTGELLPEQEEAHHLADADILVLDDAHRPLLIAECESSSSPKDYARSIQIHALARKVRITFKGRDVSPLELDVRPPILALVVIPNAKEGSQTPDQLRNVERGLKQTVLRRPFSNLMDFAICEEKDLESAAERLIVGNGRGKPGCHFDRA